MYAAELINLGSVRRGDVEYRDLKITRQLNGGMTASTTVDAYSETAPEVTIGNRALRIYDTELDVVRFCGKLREPFSRKPETISVAAGSPWTFLDRRQRATRYDTAELYGAARAAQLIVSDLITAENTRSPTRLRIGALQAAVARTRTYEVGKSIQEAIAQLAEVDDPIYFVENAVDDTAGIFAELLVRYPASGVDRPGAKFEYGDGTIGNLDDYTITEALPTNGVTAIGAGDGEAGQLTSRKTDAASIATYDLLEMQASYTDVSVQATLDQHALEALAPAPVRTYSVSPIASGDGEGEIYVPRLWRDFDVGDIVRLTIHNGANQADDVQARVTEATIAIADDTEAEQLVGLTLEAV